MAGVRLGQAFAAGFVLIRRRPWAVFAWGVLILLFVEAPLLVLLDRAASELLPLFSRPAPFSPRDVNLVALHLQQRMVVIQAMLLPAMAVRVLVAAAVYRALLEPERRAFASLRIGRQELWLFLLAFALMALGYLAGIPLYLVVVAGILGAVYLVSPFNLIGPAAIVIALLAALWCLARLSLAAPMTFSERRFRLFESWTATRRHGLQLVALGAMLFLFWAVAELAIGAAVVALVLSSLGGRPIDAHEVGVWIVALRDLDLRQAAVWLVPLALVMAALFGALSAIAAAPWASVYEQLNARPNARA